MLNDILRYSNEVSSPRAIYFYVLFFFQQFDVLIIIVLSLTSDHLYSTYDLCLHPVELPPFWYNNVVYSGIVFLCCTIAALHNDKEVDCFISRSILVILGEGNYCSSNPVWKDFWILWLLEQLLLRAPVWNRSYTTQDSEVSFIIYNYTYETQENRMLLAR